MGKLREGPSGPLADAEEIPPGGNVGDVPIWNGNEYVPGSPGEDIPPGGNVGDIPIWDGNAYVPGPTPSSGGPFIYFWKVPSGFAAGGITFPGGWGGNSPTGTEFVNSQIVPRNTTFSNMRIGMTGGLLANNDAIFTLRINGADTALAATLPFAGTTGGNFVDSVVALAGDIFSLEMDGGVGAQPNGGAIWISIEAEH